MKILWTLLGLHVSGHSAPVLLGVHTEALSAVRYGSILVMRYLPDGLGYSLVHTLHV